MFETLKMLENSITSFGEAMRILAADVQNFQTDGYKQTRSSFVSLFTQQLAKYGGGSSLIRGGASTQSVSQGVVLLPLGIDFTQGGLKPGGAFNAAIVGKGLFVLKPENLNDFVFTRASDFIMSADGSLVDSFGRRVMGFKVTNGQVDKSTLVPIKLDPETDNFNDIGFEEGGRFTTNFVSRRVARESGDEALPEGTVLFQLAVANVPNPEGMQVFVGNTFRTTLNSGEVHNFGVSGEVGLGTVSGAFSESSNVDPAETTIIGIQLQRGYNAVQAALNMINGVLRSFIALVDKA